jgi:hypothetical protein
MNISHHQMCPDIVLYRDIDLGETFMPINANEGNYVWMSIQEVVDPDNHNRSFNAVCFNDGSLRFFSDTEKVVYIQGAFYVQEYNMSSKDTD